MALGVWHLLILWLSASIPSSSPAVARLQNAMFPAFHLNGPLLSSVGVSHLNRSRSSDVTTERKFVVKSFNAREPSSVVSTGVEELNPKLQTSPAVGVTTLTINGPGHRTLRTLVWYPAVVTEAHESLTAYKYFGVIPSKHALENAPAAAGEFPLIVISHGSECSPEFHFVQAELFALQGYVVAAPTHTGNDPLNNSLAGSLVLPYFRPLDISAVLDFMETSSGLRNRRLPSVKLSSGALVLGHSYGGYTALALAGFPLSCDYVIEIAKARGAHWDMSCSDLPTDLTSQDLRDARIIGAIALDPAPLFPFTAASEAKAPGLLFSGTLCKDSSSPPLFGFRNETAQYYSLWAANHGRLFSVTKSAAHMSFTNFCEFLGYGIASPEVEDFYRSSVCGYKDPDNEQVLDIVHSLSEAFAGAVLRHERGGWAALASGAAVPPALHPFLETYDTEGFTKTFIAAA